MSDYQGDNLTESNMHPLFEAVATKLGLDLTTTTNLNITTENEKVRVEWEGLSTMTLEEFQAIIKATEDEGWRP